MNSGKGIEVLSNTHNLACAIRDCLTNDGSKQVASFLDPAKLSVRTALHADELHQRALKLAGSLDTRIPAGQNVILAMETSPEFLIGLIACFYAGILVAPAPLPRPGLFASRLDGIIEDSGAVSILSATEHLPLLQRSLSESSVAENCTLIDINQLDGSSPTAQLRGFQQAADRPALLQYTSGSTLVPKGVVLSNHNLLQNAALISRRWQVDADSIVMNWLPNFHDMGLMGGILFPLLSGGTTIQLATSAFVKKPARWLKAISMYSATHSGGPPFAYAHCLEHADRQNDAFDLSSWKIAYCGAEPVPARLLQEFRGTFATCGLDARAVFATYGMAEASLFVAGERVWDAPSSPLAGSAMEPCRLSAETRNSLRIVDPATCRPLDAGQEGEVWVRSSYVSSGYWNKAELSQAVLQAQLPGEPGHWLRTGDLGVIHDNNLIVTGRTKDTIIADGKNVTAADIEWLAADQHLGLNPLAAIAFQHDLMLSGQATLLIEVNSSRVRLSDPDQLKQRIRSAIMRAFDVHLKEIVFLRRGSLERTSSGKIRRQAMISRFKAGDLLPEVA